MDCSTPGFPVYHQLLEFAQTHDHRVSAAIQPSHPVIPVSSCLQSLPASRSFQMSQFFPSGSQSFGASASTSVLPMNIQGLFPLVMTGLILQFKGLSSPLHHYLKVSILLCLAFFMVQLSDPYMTIGKSIALIIWTFVRKMMSLLFNKLSLS